MQEKGNYIQFLNPSELSMILRSGKSININDFGTSQLYKDLTILVKGNNDEDTLHTGYCETCFTIFSLFQFLEKYYKKIRGEEKIINEDNVEMLMDIYKYIREKLEDFIEAIENGTCNDCECNESNQINDGLIHSNIRYMQDIYEQDEYVKFKNYSGYGSERVKYRIYHLNFFDIEYLDGVQDEDEDEKGELYITRNWEEIKNELIHWLKYFKQDHQFIIDTTSRKELLKYLNNDCVGEIMKFLSYTEKE